MFAGDGSAAKSTGQEVHVAQDSQLLRENERRRQELAEGCREQKSALLSAQDQAEQGKPNGLALVESVSAVRVFRC